jgi:hypothetical protein
MEDSDKVAGTLQILIQEIDYISTGTEPAWFHDVRTNAKVLTRSKSFSSPPVPTKPGFQDLSPDSVSSSPVSDSDIGSSSSGSLESISLPIDVFCTTPPQDSELSLASKLDDTPKRRSVNRSMSFSPPSDLVSDPQGEGNTDAQAPGNSQELQVSVTLSDSSSFNQTVAALKPQDPKEASSDSNNKRFRHTVVFSHDQAPTIRSRRAESFVRALSETALVTSLAFRRHGPAVSKEDLKRQKDAPIGERAGKMQQLSPMSMQSISLKDCAIENI